MDSIRVATSVHTQATEIETTGADSDAPVIVLNAVRNLFPERITLWTIRTFGSNRSLGSYRPEWALFALLARRALYTLLALRPLGADSSILTILACRADWAILAILARWALRAFGSLDPFRPDGALFTLLTRQAI